MAKKQYFCEELNNVLSCFHDRIMSCCSGIIGPVYIEGYKGEKIDWEAFKKVKRDAFEMFDEDNIKNTPCANCYYLRERTEDDVISDKFNFINISHWTHCNCGCIYCARMYDSKGKISHKKEKSQYYDFLPVLKQLYKEDLLDKQRLIAVIQGGDISVLKEFEDIVKTFLKNGIYNIHILTNNIVYQPIIRKLLEKDKVVLFTSLDAGTRETYLKLKRVDKFNDSINNLRKYVKGIKEPNIIVKYILVEHFNDNKGEIKAFLDLMSDIGIKRVEFMIENKWALFTNLDEKPLPSNFGELFLYFKEECEKHSIKLQVWNKLEYIINKYALCNEKC